MIIITFLQALTSYLQGGVTAGDLPDVVGGDAPIDSCVIILLSMQDFQEEESSGVQLNVSSLVEPVEGPDVSGSD